MPAPTPIQIRYGMDPTALGGLALATGTARRQYADYQNQLASDRSFLRGEANRRTADSRFRNNFNLSLLGMQANERMAREQATALQDAAGVQSFRQRQTAQTGGVVAPVARAGQPVTLVPESGPIDGVQREGGGYIDFRDGNDPDGPIQRVFSRDGELTRLGVGGLIPVQGRGVRGEAQQGIPIEERAKIDYVEALIQSGAISEDRGNALRVAARQGSLSLKDIKSIVDDTPSGGSSAKTGGERLAYSAALTDARIRAAESILDPKERSSAMMAVMGYTKAGSSDYRRTERRLADEWRAYKTRVNANLSMGDPRPTITRRRDLQGETNTNPIPVTSPSQVRGLSGLWVRDETGRVFRVK